MLRQLGAVLGLALMLSLAGCAGEEPASEKPLTPEQKAQSDQMHQAAPGGGAPPAGGAPTTTP